VPFPPHTLILSLPLLILLLIAPPASSRLPLHLPLPQDIEFTVQDGVLYLLQTRSGKRSARASVCVAASMVRERMITEREALLRIDPNHMDFFLHPTIDLAAGKLPHPVIEMRIAMDNPICLSACLLLSLSLCLCAGLCSSVPLSPAPPDDPSVIARIIGKGVGVSPGAAVGHVVFSGKEAQESVARGEPCILVRMDTGEDDLPGLTVRPLPLSLPLPPPQRFLLMCLLLRLNLAHLAPTPLHVCRPPPTPLHPCTPAPLHPCTPTPLHPCSPTP
jgi:hypothetical protein